MITESKVTEIFCIADDFCKEFEEEIAEKAIQSSAGTPGRRSKVGRPYFGRPTQRILLIL